MNNNFKYFTFGENETIDSIKKQFKLLAFKYHPDVTKTDTNKIMADIITEYEKALKNLGELNNKNYSLDQDYINIINELIKLNMENVEIEVCGWFIYLWGNTKPYKTLLGKDGLKMIFNFQKSCWVWKPAWYTKKSGKAWDMEKIRNTYGSETVKQERKEREKIAV